MKKTTKKPSQNNGTLLGLAGLAVAGIAGAYFLYGKNGAKNRKKIATWTLHAKADVLEKLEKTKEVSQETFHMAVDEIATKYGTKFKNVSAEDVTAFAKDLKKHWKDIKSELTPKKKPVAKKTSPKKTT
jgi:gas vesicle protein